MRGGGRRTQAVVEHPLNRANGHFEFGNCSNNARNMFIASEDMGGRGEQATSLDGFGPPPN